MKYLTYKDKQKDKESTQTFPWVPNVIKSFKWKWYEYPEMWWRRCFWNWASEIPGFVRRFWQRGARGYADCDVWNFDGYLANIIYHGLLKLRKDKMGYPSTPDPITGEWSFDEKRWNDVLGRMIAGWELAYKCTNGDLEHPGEMTEVKKAELEAIMQKNWPEFRYLTYEEEMIMREGFYLFSKYFFNLWD